MSYDLAKFKHGLEELRITLTDHPDRTIFYNITKCWWKKIR